MSTSTATDLRPFSPGFRAVAVILAALIITLLVIASWLEPDPSGLGTHRQLGLPPCTFRWLVNYPCPSCGMTTSWANLMHGRLSRAVAANAGGTLLALVAVALAPWLLVSAVKGRWVAVVPTDRRVAMVALVIAGVTLLDWFRRLGREQWW